MANAQWLTIFEDRYGVGALDRLTADLRRPCVTFAEIAKRFGVTRERVRQWQLLLLPGAPRGHERQRLCARYRQKRRLLEDPLFRSFYKHARPHLHHGRIELLKGRDGYLSRAVKIDRRLVVIKDASGATKARPGSPAGQRYSLARHNGAADFIYYRLTEDDYLFLPARDLPARGATFLDGPESRYAAFKNTFGALHEGAASGAPPVEATSRPA